MRLSIHSKFLISLITLVSIALTSMGLVLLRDADKRLEQFKFLQAKSQARSLAENSVEPLLVQNYPMIENLVRVVVSEEHYAYAAVVTPAGVVVSHSDLAQVGRHMATLSESGQIKVNETIENSEKIKEIIHPITLGEKHLANAHVAYYADTDSRMANETLTWLTEIVAFTFVTITLGSLLITRRLTKPIIELTAAVNENSTDVRLNVDERVLQRDDEIGALAQAFKNMSDQLVDKLEELEYQIRERDTARAANETKSAFLANVSHELRTPLNAIIGYSEILIEGAEEDNRQADQKDLFKIRNSARHLSQLIDDMLDLSKIEAGKMDVQCVPVNLNNLIAEITTTIYPIMEKNNNRFQCADVSPNTEVLGDSLRIKQVILNLLSNAAKFTKNGQVILKVESGGKKINIHITDTGIGMTGEQAVKVFDAFTQADKNTTIKYGGTGLGLTISRRLCRMMGGDIAVKSELGAGSTFTVSLPVAPALLNLAVS